MLCSWPLLTSYSWIVTSVAMAHCVPAFPLGFLLPYQVVPTHWLHVSLYSRFYYYLQTFMQSSFLPPISFINIVHWIIFLYPVLEDYTFSRAITSSAKYSCNTPFSAIFGGSSSMAWMRGYGISSMKMSCSHSLLYLFMVHTSTWYITHQ